MDQSPRTSSRWTASCETGRGRALNVPADVEDLLRELAPQVLGALARRSGDFDAAEDAVQEALIAAADALAARTACPREPARLAAADRRTPADRPAAQRAARAATASARRSLREPAARRTVPDEDDTLPCCSCAAIRR